MRRGCTHARSPDQTESPTGASDPEIIRVLTLSTRVAPLLSIHIRYCTSESREPPWSPGALPRYATSRLMHSRLGLAMSTFRYGRSDARGRPVHGAGVARSRRQTSAERRGDRTRTGHAPHATLCTYADIRAGSAGCDERTCASGRLAALQNSPSGHNLPRDST